MVARARVVMPAVIGYGEVPWRVWAGRVSGLTPTEAAVLRALARLADWRGELVCSTDWMIGTTGASRASVLRALAALEGGGALIRTRRYRRGCPGAGRAASLITLMAARVVLEPDEERVVHELPDFSSQGPYVGTDDDEGLRAAIEAASATGWKGPGTGVVARSLDAATGAQMSKAQARGIVFNRMGREESRMDTMSWAWQVLRESEQEIARASSPWAYWTASTTRAVVGARDVVIPEEACDPALMPVEAAPMPGECDAPLVGLGEIGPVLGGAVEALVRAGVDETVAWAGTRRVAELSLRGASHAHTAAAQDPRLEDLGVCPAVARAWMTMIRGSRRGTKAPLVELGVDQVVERAGEVARCLSESLVPALAA